MTVQRLIQELQKYNPDTLVGTIDERFYDQTLVQQTYIIQVKPSNYKPTVFDNCTDRDTICQPMVIIE
jgi:hypothetical protein